ncbi:MAG TPA: hypothetical protein VGJ54_16915 [Streptosporangiaceae bacterium]|jgi:hypothetical protein
MAQTQLCDNEDGQPALILIHSIASGDVEGYCGPCFQVFCLAFADAAGWTPPAAGPDEAAVTEWTDQLASTGPGEDQNPDPADGDDDTDRDDRGGYTAEQAMTLTGAADPNGKPPARKRAPRKAAPRASRAGAR